MNGTEYPTARFNTYGKDALLLFEYLGELHAPLPNYLPTLQL